MMQKSLKTTETLSPAQAPAKKAWKKSKLDHTPIVDDTANQKIEWQRELRFYFWELRPRNAS